jgi:CO/xanthine dehydrogenase FAD-binding subunit
MIKEYFRPKTIHEAVDLLKKNELAIPIGGGTSINNNLGEIVLVDLQDLDLSFIRNVEKNIIIGSMTTLEQIKSNFIGNDHLKKVLKIEGSKNQRTQSSLGGFLKLAGGRSPLLTSLLTLNCTLYFAEQEKGIALSEFLDIRKTNKQLITHISIMDPVGMVFESVSRSPLDLPIICCAVNYINKDMKAAVGGFGEKPQIVPDKYFIEQNECEISTFMQFTTDEWASANYRANITRIVLKRLIALTEKGEK